MKILQRQEIWIHTHFVTDCTYLPDHLARAIGRQADRLLERLRIVFGIHFDGRYDGGLRIVLECIPLPETMEKVESGLKEIIGPLPARPRKTKVRIGPPRQRVKAVRR